MFQDSEFTHCRLKHEAALFFFNFQDAKEPAQSSRDGHGLYLGSKGFEPVKTVGKMYLLVCILGHERAHRSPSL
jgi:hypothetical protein